MKKNLPPTLLAWIILLIAAAAFYYFFSQAPAMRCVRTDSGNVDCVVQDRILGLLAIRQRSATNVKAASVATECKNDDCRYRVELIANQGKVPFIEAFTPNADLKINIADSVNEFLADTGLATIEQRGQLNPLFVYPPLVVLALFGIYELWQRGLFRRK